METKVTELSDYWNLSGLIADTNSYWSVCYATCILQKLERFTKDRWLISNESEIKVIAFKAIR